MLRLLSSWLGEGMTPWVCGGLVSVSGVLAIQEVWSIPSAAMVAEGKELFLHEWTEHDPLSGDGDGLGPVFNARSCAACHALGGLGGAGTRAFNVTAFEVDPRPDDPLMHFGVVHASATSEYDQESIQQVHRLYPKAVKERRTSCGVYREEFNPLHFHQVNTPALWGLGQIDEMSNWSIVSNHHGELIENMGKELSGQFEENVGGKVRILSGGRVGKFGWKGQFATLEEFVAAACAVELGLSNHRHQQMMPTKFVEDEQSKPDMTRRQLAGLVAFCKTLPAPRQEIPSNPKQELLVRRGEELFSSIGCTKCHPRNLGGVDGIYSDLRLHRLVDLDQRYTSGRRSDIARPAGMPEPDEWKTPPLWGVADTAPYMHDGSATSLEDAILAHRGQASDVTEKFQKAEQKKELNAIVAFLKTLRAP